MDGRDELKILQAAESKLSLVAVDTKHGRPLLAEHTRNETDPRSQIYDHYYGPPALKYI